MDTANTVKLALDTIRHKVSGNYSKEDTSETLRQAFIDANGGSTKFGIKEFRKHPELYDIIEELIPTIVHEGLTADEFFMNFVDYRNEALGNDTEFWVEDNSLFIVSAAGHGTQGIRRQRIGGATKTTVTKTLKVIKIYEELNRLLAGRVDFNTFVTRIADSMRNDAYTNIFNAFNGITAATSGMNSTYYISGSYSEDSLLTLAEHVEATNNAGTTIIGTKSALRRITTAAVSEAAKNDLYNIGYYGRFNSIPLISAKQRHTIGTDTFILDDTKLYVVANNDKFIKYITVGEGLLLDGDPMAKADLTKEFLYGEETGIAVAISGHIGVFDLT